MSRSFQTHYQALSTLDDENDEAQEDVPVDNVIQIVPDHSKSRWNHIEDLDEFFSRVYQYHQRCGFRCMVVEDFLLIFQFMFVVLFAIFLCTFINYGILFGNESVNKSQDIILPWNEAKENFGFSSYTSLTFGVILTVLSLFKFIYSVFKFWEIRAFYTLALKVNPSELVNMTWHEVQRRLLDAQRELQMCIHKAELTELDIYHRMLRFKNYMIAMVNKSVLPLSFRVPFVGQHTFLTTGLKYNLEMILFWGPWAPFENSWHVKKEYKSKSKRKELADYLSQKILLIGVANLVLCPIIFLYQIFYSFFRYTEIVKRDPSLFGLRRWSLYGRLFLRHFNELDHEFNARLSRGYRPAKSYMNIFASPLIAILAKHFAFICASIVAVMIVFTIIDQDILRVDHFLGVITLLSVVVTICRQFIPDEYLVFCPELLLRAVLAQIHYMPDSWKGQAHTQTVRWEFSQLFPYTFTCILEEVLSPILTPFILICAVRHKAQDIVDFFHNYTVDVTGVGDVCSFAQMNIKKHGHPEWTHTPGEMDNAPRNPSRRAELGKTELSLMHFTLTNPQWRPQDPEDHFVSRLRTQVQREGAMSSLLLPLDNPLLTSSHSLTGAAGYNSGSLFSTVHKSLVYPSTQFSSESVMRPSYASDPTPATSRIGSPPPPVILGGVRNLDYPSLVTGSSSIVSGVARPMTVDDGFAGTVPGVQTNPPGEAAPTNAQGLNETDEGATELLSAEMSASALYLHDLHLWKKSREGLRAADDEQARRMWEVSADSSASSLGQRSSVRMSSIREGIKEADENAGRCGDEKDCLIHQETLTLRPINNET